MENHRGPLILVFGILGVTACAIFAPIAWIMGSSDLEKIRAGRMDPEGESLTNIGKILGMVGSILILVGIAIWVVMLVFMFGIAAVGAAQ